MPKHIGNLSDDLLGTVSRLVVVRDPKYGIVAKITDGQLERKAYLDLNEALMALGGKWNRHAGGHVFAMDPSGLLDDLLLTGTYKTRFAGDFYQTPVDVAKAMAAWAVRTGDRVLEPSAGEGALVRAIWGRKADHITAVEIDEDRCDKLADLIDSCRGDGKRAFTSKILRVDFLNLVPDVVCAAADFDSVVMNPPFSRAAEARHVLHAMKFLKSGGRLAAIMSGGIRYRQDKVYQQLRDALGAQTMDALEDLPEDTFKSAGTCVSTVIVQWVKP